jgi:acyl-CoA thioester hydrolase
LINPKTNFELEIYLEDTDAFGIVYHANYVKFFERGRVDWLAKNGYKFSEICNSGYKMLVPKLSIDFLLPCRLGDKLIVQTELAKQKLSLLVFEQSIVNMEQMTAAKAQIKIVALDSSDKLCHISNLIPGLR